MITMQELLSDKQFKEWMLQVPQLPPIAYQSPTPPWRLFVQREPGGRWAYKDFPKYADAYKWMKPRLDRYHDFALHCRRIASPPPRRLVRVKGKFHVDSDGVKRPLMAWSVWKPRLTGDDMPHEWCPYCRRPTVFKHYAKHHARPGSVPVDPNVARCCICSASQRIAPPWRSYAPPVKASKKRRSK